MDGYLGYFDPPEDHPYINLTPKDWAMKFIERYGQIDGSHHKQWVLDQVARILLGTPVTVKVAKWKNAEQVDRPDVYDSYAYVDIDNGIVGEYRFWIEDEDSSDEYKEWVMDMLGEYDEESEEYEYGYDVGIAP